MNERVIKPGRWFIVRIRKTGEGNEVVGHLKLRNSSAAGPTGRGRRYRRVRKGYGWARRYVARQWRVDYSRRRAYQFADLADARAGARTDTVKDWMDRGKSIVSGTTKYLVEILEVEGCLFYGTVVKETVVVRKLPDGLTGMQVIALASLGE